MPSRPHPRDALFEVASGQEGLFTTVQAADAGYSPQLLQWLARRLRVPRGVVLHHADVPLNQWDALTLFLSDAHLPVDDNASENALRIAAQLGSAETRAVDLTQVGGELEYRSRKAGSLATSARAGAA